MRGQGNIDDWMMITPDGRRVIVAGLPKAKALPTLKLIDRIAIVGEPLLLYMAQTATLEGADMHPTPELAGRRMEEEFHSMLNTASERPADDLDSAAFVEGIAAIGLDEADWPTIATYVLGHFKR